MVSIDFFNDSKMLPLLFVVAVWTVNPLIRRCTVDRASIADPDGSAAIQVVLLILGVSYAIVVTSQFCMRQGPATQNTFLTHVQYIRADGIALLVASSCLTLLSNMVLTRQLVLHSPGTIMPMLNALANISTYVCGTIMYGNGVTWNGCMGMACLTAGIFLLNLEKH